MVALNATHEVYTDVSRKILTNFKYVMHAITDYFYTGEEGAFI